MAKTNQIEFGVKNVRFAVKDQLGGYETPEDLAYAESIALTPVFNEDTIYGDGKAIAVIASDKGYTGSLAVVQPSEAYEIAMKRKIKTPNGLVDIQQKDNIEHALYYEFDVIKDGVVSTGKVWLLNLTSGRPTESFTQSKENPTVNNIEYAFTVMGDVMKDADGIKDYVDENGNTYCATRVVARPSDTGYDTFGEEVPIVKHPGA